MEKQAKWRLSWEGGHGAGGAVEYPGTDQGMVDAREGYANLIDLGKVVKVERIESNIYDWTQEFEKARTREARLCGTCVYLQEDQTSSFCKCCLGNDKKPNWVKTTRTVWVRG